MSRKISIAITTHNRIDLTMQSFENVIDDPRIGEIVIIDDYSNKSIVNELHGRINILNSKYNKIKFIVNEFNLGMSMNKYKAIQNCSNEWIILLDSDNIIYKNYIDILFTIPEWYNNVIYAPVIGMPNLDYSDYSGLNLNKAVIQEFIDEPLINPLLNTCNYFINKDEYLINYSVNILIKESDTIWFNYLWLKNGNYINIVPNLTYYHRVHEDSGYMKNYDYNLKRSKEIIQLIKEL